MRKIKPAECLVCQPSSYRYATMEDMDILITGASGFIGTHLGKQLVAQGHTVHALVHRRTPDFHCKTYEDIARLPEVDAIINLAGAGIADKRWSKRRKKTLYSSRVTLTEQLVAHYNQLSKTPSVWINASALGFYGNHGTSDVCLTEDSPANPGFQNNLITAWEAAAQTANVQRVCILRFGIVLGNGGMLKRLKRPYQWGVGGRIGSGQQWLSWVHVDDVCRLIQCCLDDSLYQGVYNTVAPEPVKQRDFKKALGRRLCRPTLCYTPAWLLRLLLGEMSELLIGGARLAPQRLEKQGFRFQYPSLEQALEACWPR